MAPSLGALPASVDHYLTNVWLGLQYQTLEATVIFARPRFPTREWGARSSAEGRTIAMTYYDTRMKGAPMAARNECTFYRWDSMKKERVSDMLERRLITGDRMMLAQVYLKKWCIVPKH